MDCDEAKFLNGRRVGAYNTNLPETIGLERNFMKIPLCVPHATSSITKIEYTFPPKTNPEGEIVTPKFAFIKSTEIALPLPQHSKILDILMGLFAHNFRDDGLLYFSYAAVAKIAGISTKNSTVIKQAILRYHHGVCNWNLAWKNGKMDSWVGHLIEYTSLNDLGEKIPNARNSNREEDYNCLKFHSSIIFNIKMGKNRLFYKDAIKTLTPSAYQLYKHFYAFSDQTPVFRNITKLMEKFCYTGRKSRFLITLTKNLKILSQQGYVSFWKIEGDLVTIKCNNIKKIRKNVDRKILDRLIPKTMKLAKKSDC